MFDFAGQAVAQVPVRAARTGPWAGVNNSRVATPPSWDIVQLVTLAPTFTWGMGYQRSSPGYVYSLGSVRATNAAGTEFSQYPITGSPYAQPTNISVPAGVLGNTTAFVGAYGAPGPVNIPHGGEVLRTTDGGLTWRTITTTQFPNPGGFCNWVHAFDANTVVAGGDPLDLPPGAGPGPFEFWYSTNASGPVAAVTWTRANTPAPLSVDELALVGAYTAVGDAIWAGTSNTTSNPPSPVRVLRSTDRGRNWTAALTPMTGSVPHLAFKDQLHGLAFTVLASGLQVMTTADGGLTWTMQTPPNPTTADTLRGKFYQAGIAAIPNVGFVSYGRAIANNRNRSNRGASFSPDGVTWTDIDNGGEEYLSASFLQCGPVGFQGYLGGSTAPATPTSAGGTGGIYQVANSCALLTSKPAAHRPALAVVPNPSPTGVFELQLDEALVGAAHLLVTDALGRTVVARSLAATGRRRQNNSG